MIGGLLALCLVVWLVDQVSHAAAVALVVGLIVWWIAVRLARAARRTPGARR